MKSVCILGAGVSGLAFAFRLEQLHANCRVTIYEAEGQVGGRVRTVSRSGTLSDVGANYLTFDMLK
jgi:protoporphyrinogen oxidase